MNAVVQHDNSRLPSLPSGGQVRAIVPQDFEGAWRIASAVCKAGMAPKGLETPEKAMVAIMHGMEVGLTPMAALQSIAVINSRATLWGDGALGVVQASGKMESFKEWFEGEGDSRKALCLVKRKGDPEAKLGEFSVSNAKKASLWGKSGPWSQYADRMLKMRARAFALRDGFSDVLRGLGIAEEVQDIPTVPVDVPPSLPSPPSPPSPSATIEHQPSVDVESASEEFDAAAYFEDLETQLSGAMDDETVEEIWTEMDPEGTFDGDDLNLEIAHKIKARRLVQIHPINAG